MRSLFLLALTFVLCLFHGKAILLRAQALKEPLSPSAKQQFFKERDQLLSEAKQLFQAKKFSAGLSRFQQIVSIEEKLYGPNHEQVVTRLKQLAQGYELLSNWKFARRALLQIAEIRNKVHGKYHWKNQDSQRAIIHLNNREKLTPQLRGQLHQAAQWNTQAAQAYRAGRRNAAIQLLQKSLEIRGKILGKKTS